jgi:hypothetical protein
MWRPEKLLSLGMYLATMASLGMFMMMLGRPESWVIPLSTTISLLWIASSTQVRFLEVRINQLEEKLSRRIDEIRPDVNARNDAIRPDAITRDLQRQP